MNLSLHISPALLLFWANLILLLLNLFLWVLLALSRYGVSWKTAWKSPLDFLRRLPRTALFILGSETLQFSKGGRSKFLGAKSRKHITLSVCAGFLLAPLLALYFSRIYPLAFQMVWVNSDSFIHWDFWILTILCATPFLAALAWLNRPGKKNLPVSLSKAAKPLSLSALATLASFAAGFLLCGLGVRTLGIAFYNHCDIWNRIRTAGFSLEAPPRGPALPDAENAVYYLNQSMAIPSASTLSPFFHENAPPFLKNQKEWSFLNSFRQMGGGNRITPEAAADAARLVIEHAETFRLVDKAFGMKADARLRFSGYTNVLSDLLACRAYLQIRQGFPKRALRSVEEILFLGDIYRQNPYLAGQVEDVEFFDEAMTVFRQIFPKVNADLLNKEFLPALKLQQREAGYRLCWPLELFEVDSTHPTNLGWWDYIFKNDITRFFLRDRFNSPVPSFRFGLFYWPLEPFDQTYLYERSLDALKALDAPYSRRYQAFQAESNLLKSRHWLSLTVNDRGAGDLVKLDKMIAWGRVTQTAIRARLYREKNKRWPNSLSELSGDPADISDPFADGAALNLQAVPNGIQIYSQGIDTDVYGLKRGDRGDSGVFGNIGWNLKD